MNQSKNTPRSFWLTLIVFLFALSIWAAISTYTRAGIAGIILQRSVWGGMLLVYSAIALACIGLVINRSGAWFFRMASFFELSYLQRKELRIISFVIFLGILLFIPYIKFHYGIGQFVQKPVYDPGMLLILYYWSCAWLLLLAMVALKVAFTTSWQAGLASALVILGAVYESMARFNAVTTYPLSMGWSEGSRYYYASLYFSKWIYGATVPLSTLHPTRYLLQSIPFLFSTLGLPAHRLWQYLLWISLTAGAAVVLSRRVTSPKQKAFRWLLAGWYFLFLLRVGVYYHLEVMTIIPLLFVSTKHPWRSLLAVIIASLWAGISRVNWYPVPAMIAVAIYVLETPVNQSGALSFRRLVHYLATPALWMIAGLIAALAAQAAYIPLSGNANNAEAFASSFSSALLWYRLWPNDNFALGIVPAILIVTGPLLVILLVTVFRSKRALHPLRWLALFSIILVLFAGSLVVSTKIGGGGDLHNMDSYATLIGIVALFFIGGNIQPEPNEPKPVIDAWPAMVSGLIMPLFFLIPILSPYPKFNMGAAQQAHQQLVNTVNTLAKNGPVLFINERQLVTFGDVQVPLVPEYEVVTLMEMAMSDNKPYLDAFYQDLASHRFAAIVATKQNRAIKQSGPLMEENNVWNSRVSPYILCYYEPALQVDADISRIVIYVPTSLPADCP